MFLLNWLSSIMGNNYIYFFNAKFKMEDVDEEQAVLLADKFLEFVENLGLESNGAVSYKSVNLTLSSDQEIRRSTVDRVKKWISIHGIQEFKVSDVIREKR